jgi:hypothetical protein
MSNVYQRLSAGEAVNVGDLYKAQYESELATVRNTIERLSSDALLILERNRQLEGELGLLRAKVKECENMGYTWNEVTLTWDDNHD